MRNTRRARVSLYGLAGKELGETSTGPTDQPTTDKRGDGPIVRLSGKLSYPLARDRSGYISVAPVCPAWYFYNYIVTAAW